ncbi:hypothetical protein pb186bvf_009135 [Paramecium bursaria]
MEKENNMAFQEITLKSNHHECRINPARPIHHYRIEMTLSSPELVQAQLKELRPRLLELLNQYYSLNQNIYSPTLLKERKEVLNILPIEGNVEQANTIELVHQGQVSDIKEKSMVISRLVKQVLRCQYSMTSVGNKGQKLFWPNRAQKFQDQNLEIWPGVEVVLKNYESSSLVIDCAFKMLRYRTALEELCSDKQSIDNLTDQIVMTQYNKKFYKVEGIDVQLRPTSSFLNEKGESITYQQYYQQRYNVKIDPNQPLIKATQERVVYLIPQLCQLTGLTDSIRNDFHAMKALATVTKPNAETRIKLATEFSQQLSNTQIKNKQGDQRNLFKEWGVEVNPTPMEIKARRIHPGNMVMGSNLRLDLANPSTNLDRSTQTQMYSTPNYKLSLVIVYIKRTGQRTIESFMQNFQAAIKDFNFNVFSQPIIRSIEQDNEQELDQALNQVGEEAARNNAKVGFVIFLLPGQKKKARLYKAAKRITMNKFGVASQVIIERTLEKNTRSIVNKILVQLNAKVGGTPWAIDGMPQIFQNKPTMLCGTDCFQKAKRQSQLAFCSTVDQYFSRYYSQIITSGEFSTHLQPAFKASLLAFKAHCGVFPENVIIYRDGIGEGQENQVISTELPQYKQALAELEMQDKVKIVLVICNKRVSAKFYTAQRPENPQPGTLIDSAKVCEDKKFYLISQVSRQGTVTPSLYKIAHSDINNIDDDVKVLTFKLCWLFYNYTGSIKIPAPVRYAHCLCNFIGDNYSTQDRQMFMPIEDLVRQKVLYFI